MPKLWGKVNGKWTNNISAKASGGWKKGNIWVKLNGAWKKISAGLKLKFLNIIDLPEYDIISKTAYAPNAEVSFLRGNNLTILDKNNKVIRTITNFKATNPIIGVILDRQTNKEYLVFKSLNYLYAVEVNDLINGNLNYISIKLTDILDNGSAFSTYSVSEDRKLFSTFSRPSINSYAEGNYIFSGIFCIESGSFKLVNKIKGPTQPDIVGSKTLEPYFSGTKGMYLSEDKFIFQCGRKELTSKLPFGGKEILLFTQEEDLFIYKLDFTGLLDYTGSTKEASEILLRQYNNARGSYRIQSGLLVKKPHSVYKDSSDDLYVSISSDSPENIVEIGLPIPYGDFTGVDSTTQYYKSFSLFYEYEDNYYITYSVTATTGDDREDRVVLLQLDQDLNIVETTSYTRDRGQGGHISSGMNLIYDAFIVSSASNLLKLYK